MSEPLLLVPRQQDEQAHDEPAKPPLALRDFAAQPRSGAPGVRWYTDPRTKETLVGVPVGMNWDKAKEFRMPAVQSRREWERNRVRAPHQTDTVRIRVTACARCTILIGKGFFQHEAYLEPVLPPTATPQTKPLWQIVCAIHALERGLHAGFCLLGDQDWIELSDHQIRHQFRPLRALKAQQLERQFMPAWQAYLRKRHTAFLTLGQRWIASPRDRSMLWEEVMKPEWSFYLKLYYRAIANKWWQQYDLTGQGCPEHHSRPEECAVSFHQQLPALKLAVLFREFTSIVQPEIATIRNLLPQEETAHAA